MQAVESRLLTFDYDNRGAQVDWTTKHYKESSAGRHITRTMWPNGLLKTRTAKKTNEAGTEPTVRTYEYFYNRNRSLVGMNDVRDPGSATDDRLTSIARDPVERQSAVNETWTSGKDSLFAYDIAGNVLTRKTDGKIDGSSFIGTDAKSTTFEYDSLDREFQMAVEPATGADRETVTNYWPSGRRQSRRKPNGTSERWFYSTRGEVSRFERQRDGQNTLARETDYGYDANGNRDLDERGTHVFNARDQLVKWSKPSSGQVTEYDLNGDGATTERRLYSSPTDTSAETETFVYRGERLWYAETADVRAYHRYDDFGNVVRIRQHARVNGEFPEISDEAPPQPAGCGELPASVENDETYYCYDEFERMRLARGANIAEPETLGYDGLDRRDARSVPTGPTTFKTRDLSYVGMSELLSREVDDDGEKRFYDYDSAGDRQGQQVNDSSGTRYRAYTKDANGSVLGLEDGDGEVASGERYDYDPYGELDSDPTDAEAAANPFRFEGFYFDSGVKSYDMQARAYRPDVGRFLTQDRYASASRDLLLQADPLTQNRYAFAGANPVNDVEFDGHKRIDCKFCTATGGPPKDKQDDERRHQAHVVQVNKAGWNRWFRSADYNQQASPEGQRALAAERRLNTWKPGREIRTFTGGCLHHSEKYICNEELNSLSLSEAAHAGLDIVGLIPVVGEPADLANCGLYAHEGKKVEAGLSCAAAVPVFGWLATGAKTTKRAVDAGGGAAKEARTFHRLESPTQTAETARKQERSGEIWGRPNRGSDIPSVDAYRGPLPPGKRGIEFETDVAPNAGSPPGRARWYGDRPGVRIEDGYAKICTRITKNTQC